MEFIKNYRNFEDDTSLYYLMHNNKETSFSFSMEPLVLYRISEKTLTNSVDNAGQIAFLDDLHKFRKFTFKQEKHISTKLFLALIMWDTFLMKHRFNASKALDRKIRKKKINKILKSAQKYEDLKVYKDKYISFTKSEEVYLEHIKKSASDFIKGLEYEEN